MSLSLTLPASRVEPSAAPARHIRAAVLAIVLGFAVVGMGSVALGLATAGGAGDGGVSAMSDCLGAC